MQISGFNKKIVLGLGVGLASNMLAKSLNYGDKKENGQYFDDEILSQHTNQTADVLIKYKDKLSMISKRFLNDDKCSGWPKKVFSPYVQVSSDNVVNITDMYNKTGQQYYTFAFINSFNNTPHWSEEKVYNSSLYDKQIEQLRRNGGNIMISFGGADGQELATSISNEEDLQKAYQQVIDRYKLTWMDLDIEGESLKDTSSNSRRNKVIAKLQKDNPELVLSYCLPADLKGLSLVGVRLLEDAISKGVSIDVVNAMAMHYGHEVDNISEKKMAGYVITTANKVREQIEGLELKNTKVGITVVIGNNDEETFTIEDANEVLKWSKQVDWLRFLSFWTANRDNGNNAGHKELDDSSSGIEQALYGFTDIFKNFTDKDLCYNIDKNKRDDHYIIYLALGITALAIGVASLGYLAKRKKAVGCTK